MREMKKGPVCYIYCAIKNKRRAKANNSDLSYHSLESKSVDQRDIIKK